MSEGKVRKEAVRALKRFIIRAIWRLWQECLHESFDTCQRQDLRTFLVET